jgi:DNA replication protein DnaC
MKKTIVRRTSLALAVFTLIASTIILSCNSPAEKVENAQTDVIDANKDLEKANEDYLAEVESYKKETADKIAANEQSIMEFNARIATEKKEARVAYKQKIAELEMKNTDMKKKLDDYKQDGKENWEKFKTEFNHDMDELGKAFKDLTVKNVK